MIPSRSPARLVLLLVAAVSGCAVRQEAPVAAGGRDARREEIARLDRRIAEEEAAVGVRRAAPPMTVDAQTNAEAAGGESSPGPEAPPSMELAPPPPSMDLAQPSTPSPGQAQSPGTRFAVPPPGSADGEGACPRLCRSVAAICDASGRICRLADGLDDAWADGRCEAATRSCTTAEQRAESRCAGSCR